VTLGAVVGAALVMGALGSLHCAAMCGPLVVAGAAGRRNAAGYFVGRLVAYAALGAVMGHLGRHALCMLPVGTAQAAAVGLTALPPALRGVGLMRARGPGEPLVKLRRSRSRPAFAWLASLLPREGLGLGLATGVLPCGLLIGGYALAAGTASPVEGAAAMAALSVASTPGLLVTVVGGRVLRAWTAELSPRVHGLLWCALSAWLLVRPFLVQAHCAV
jgi:sulfite exporter TauE/SafE